MRILLRSLLSFFLVLAPASAWAAAPFFDTLGTSGDVYDDTDTFFLMGDHTLTLGGSDWFQGQRFTSAHTGNLYSIDVAVGHLLGPDTIEFRLYADAGGSLGALIGTIPVQTVAENYDGAIETGLAAGTTVLTQGTSYWLMATGIEPTIWFWNETGAPDLPRLWTPDGVGAPLASDTTTAAAFRLNAPPAVPALGFPGLLLTTALLLLAATPTLRGPVGSRANSSTD